MSETWIDLYQEYASKYTDAPAEFHKYVGLSMIAAAIGNKAYFRFGDMTIYPNLWVIILAPTSLFRKSTVIKMGTSILSRSSTTTLYPNEFSIEKLLEVIKESPTGLFVLYEFITFMSLLNRDYMAGAKSMLTEFFDVPEEFCRKTMGKDFMIKKPVINILAATTADWFLEQVNERDIDAGFLPRFLYVPSIAKIKTMALPPAVNTEEKAVLAKGLSAIVGTITNANINGEIEFAISPTAKELYENWYSKHEKLITHDKQRYKTFMNRHSIYIIKLAIIYQCIIEITQGENAISAEAMTLAIRDVDHLGNKIKELCDQEMAFTRDDKHKMKIRKIIQGCPQGISQNDLLRRSGMLAKQLSLVLETLVEESRIECDFIDTGGAKKTKLWRYLED